MGAARFVPPRLLFRQLFEKESSTYTFLLADETAPNRPGVLIDPVDLTFDRDVRLAEELDVTLRFALNTHAHADHITGTGLLKKRVPGIRSVISAASGAGADVLVDHGDVIPFGRFGLQVRATPGHTKGCITFVLVERVATVAAGTAEADGQDSVWREGSVDVEGFAFDKLVTRMAFTGDALLIRGCGRTDFQEGDASQLYRSVHSQILSLPPDTLLYPAHDYQGRTVTSVEEERKYNPRLTKNEEQFKAIMDGLGLPPPKKLKDALPANMADGNVEAQNNTFLAA
ncbi:hypothetical protein CLOM_g6007 [Closterium sp. NIES-68]|nr:hypothetical protein CLOM_g6007 [Closterium sp. NIES-68]GJP76831.1 hypothetical protein CLOP_g7284 [Closterium sp. NIES-67]